MASIKTVGFIGLGAMGRGMAANLVGKGFETIVLGRSNRAPVDQLVALGASEGANPADVAERAELVLLCVADSSQVERIVYGPDGLLSAARPGLIIVDTTTSDPGSTARIHADFDKKDVDFVDAPLGRSVKEAQEGRLNTMVGATSETLEKVRPILEAYSENIFHAGGPGAGHKMKLVNNFVAMGHVALIAEALVTARKVGVDVAVLHQLLSAGPVNSPTLQALVCAALAGTNDGIKFQLDTARKDLRYYTHMAEAATMPAPMADAAHQAFLHAAAQGFGNETVGGLVRALEGLGQVRVQPDN